MNLPDIRLQFSLSFNLLSPIFVNIIGWEIVLVCDFYPIRYSKYGLALIA